MTLDTDSKKLLDWRMEINAPFFEDMEPTAARQAMAAARAAANVTPPEIGSVRDLAVSGDGPDIGLRLYRPLGAGDGPLPFLVFFHGGGWVIGDLDSHDILCRQLANGAGCAVVAVDYRLAPEHRFPACLEDAERAIRWIFAHAGDLGLDPSAAAIGGDSAGGNISAVMTHLSRDGKLPTFKYQALFYPVTDLTFARRSYDVSAQGLPVTRATMAWFRDHYLNNPAERVDWRASPVFAASMKGLPPAYVLTAGYDPLSDEGEAYARRLRDDGVPVTYREYPGQIHGFLTMGAALPTAHAAVAEIAEALKAGLAA